MKKILSILLAVLLMSSCVMTVSATSTEQSGNMTVTATVEEVSYTLDIPSSLTIGNDGTGAYNGPMILDATGINGVTKHIQITTTFDGTLTGTNPENTLSYKVMPHDDQSDAWEIEQTDFLNGMTSGQVFCWYPLEVTIGESSGVNAHPMYKSATTASLPNEIAIITTTTVEIDAEEWAEAVPDTYTDTITFSASVVQGAAFSE